MSNLERMQLAACMTVASANTPESAAKARDMHPDYHCAAVDDVAAAVDREMAHRAEVERLEQQQTYIRNLCDGHLSILANDIMAILENPSDTQP